jgi:hypothetical protein
VLSRKVMRTLFTAVLVVAPLAEGVSITQQSARPTRVEVLVPAPPIPVAAEGRIVLTYELHITNFDLETLSLAAVDVFPDAATTPIASFKGAELQKMLLLVGEAHQHSKGAPEQQNETLGQGRRVVVYLWLALDPGRKVPPSLRHRLQFRVENPNGESAESHIDDIRVPVVDQPVPVLAAPFGPGEWLAGNGPSNFSDHRRTLVPVSGGVFIAQRFATDWVMVGKNENTFHDSREKNKNFWGFGQPVYAVGDGEIMEVVDKFSDNRPDEPLKPVTLENIAGNHVILRIAPNQYVMYAHLKSGSIRVRGHQRVKSGATIAQIGNSGNTTAPHLHFQVMDRDSPLAAEGVPYVFKDFKFLGFGREFEEKNHPTLPRSHELPIDDSVVGLQ